MFQRQLCYHIYVNAFWMRSHSFRSLYVTLRPRMPLMGMTHAFTIYSHSRGECSLVHIQMRYLAKLVVAGTVHTQPTMINLN